ncbi:dTDP-4-dehydrorhamnose reductase [bacterium]|nr:dTDP-4-dehydrorhamnose reductase [bacterium]
MRCVVTGSKGLLGRAVVERLARENTTVVEADLPEVDLTDSEAVNALVEASQPECVFHCAAWTDVDRAEDEPDLCRAVNVDATRYLAEACARSGARLVLLSTDYVFGGDLDRPYREEDAPRPLGVYAQSKLEAEQAVQAGGGDWQILRSAWLFGPGRRNFVTAILDRLRAGQSLRVVNDQTGCPTFAPDLADRLVWLADHTVGGLYHLANAGHCSWYEFACRIAELAGYASDGIEAIGSDAWPSKARRPGFSVLDCTKALAAGLPPMRSWEAALGEYVAQSAADVPCRPFRT